MAQKFNEIKGDIEKSLNDPSKPWTPIFAKAEESTGINRLYMFLGNYAHNSFVFFCVIITFFTLVIQVLLVLSQYG